MERQKTTKEIIAIMLTVSFCVAFVANSVMQGWRFSRRSAEEIRIINSTEELCEEAGGTAIHSMDGNYVRCDRKAPPAPIELKE